MYNLRILNKTNNDYKQYISLIKDFRNLKSEVTYKLFLEYYDKTFKNSIIFVLEKNFHHAEDTKMAKQKLLYHPSLISFIFSRLRYQQPCKKINIEFEIENIHSVIIISPIYIPTTKEINFRNP